MRPRQQQGQITKRGPNWVLRYHEDRIVGGSVKRVRTMAVLGPYADFPKKVNKYNEEARAFFNKKISAILTGINGQSSTGVEATLTVSEFIDQRYFPRLEQRMQLEGELHIEPSTVKGYRDILKVHVKNNPIAKIQLRNFSTPNGQQFLESLPQKLSHQTHLRIKNFLRGVFTWAIASGALSGSNPMEETKAGGRTKKSELAGLSLREKKIRASQEHAYTLEEVAEMLDKLPEPARTVCATAAFTGLSRSELRGLQWGDYDGKTLKVQRKIWGDHVGVPKTEARETGVFVVPLLQKILTKYKKSFPAGEADWIFRGEKFMRPLDLDNLSRRDIPQHINGAWFGWHAFRRGLGTRLNEAGVNDKDIQSILRHADVSTTQAYYILPNHERAQAGMKKLERALKSKYNIKA